MTVMKTKMALVILILSILAATGTATLGRPEEQLKTLSQNGIRRRAKSLYDEDYNEVDLYTWPGIPKLPQRIFTTASVIVEVERENGEEGEESNYELYQSSNRSQLLEEAASNRRFFGLFRRLAVWQRAQLPPFRHSFVGVETKAAYSVRLSITRVNYAYAAVFAVSVVCFLCARRLTRNALFYYGSGTSVGLVASVLILVFILYRLLPKKSVAYSVLLGGWSFSFYLIYALWQNLSTVLLRYQKWVGVYLVSVTLLSFGVCYRLGPPRDPRSLNLLQWSMQLVSLLLIFASSQIPEMGLAAVGALLFVHNIPSSLIERLVRAYHWLRPPKRRLLSQAEYARQGRDFTAQQLSALREFCRSPDCNSWRTMSRLKSPVRMAEFVQGSSHLNDSELLAYDVDLSDDDPSSAEDSADDVQDSFHNHNHRHHQPPLVQSERHSSHYSRVSRRLRGPNRLNASMPSRRNVGAKPERGMGNGSFASFTNGLGPRMPAYDDVSDDED